MAQVDYPKMISALRAEIRTLEQSRQQFVAERERLVGMVTQANQAARALQQENLEIVGTTHGLLKMLVFTAGGPVTLRDNTRERVAQMVLEREDFDEGSFESRRVYSLREMNDEEKAKYEAARAKMDRMREEAESGSGEPSQEG